MEISLQPIDVPPGHYVPLEGIEWPKYEQILEELGYVAQSKKDERNATMRAYREWVGGEKSEGG